MSHVNWKRPPAGAFCPVRWNPGARWHRQPLALMRFPGLYGLRQYELKAMREATAEDMAAAAIVLLFWTFANVTAGHFRAAAFNARDAEEFADRALPSAAMLVELERAGFGAVEARRHVARRLLLLGRMLRDVHVVHGPSPWFRTKADAAGDFVRWTARLMRQ